ncbi:MAG: MBL fold metallo-hydrolase [Chloroflexi bacterium]|nr:MBL fold metallo-hydrolase [Chloroflexota bacterium]
MSSQPIPPGTTVPAPEVQEVSDGIFAYVQLDGSWFLNNAGCIRGARSATLIDTVGTEARARAWHATVAKLTGLPVSALINTHHHADHTNGNFMFSPPAAVIAQERCREEMVANPGFPRRSPLFPNTDFGDCPPTPPTVTFAERMEVFVDDLRIELISVGPAHTTNDLVAWIPDRKLLFSGDVIFNGGTPFAVFGSIAGWFEALDTIQALGAETIVPGHGAVCGPAAMEEVRAYLRFIDAAARRGFEAGTPPLELARGLELGPFAHLCDPERIVGNLHRAYSELRGEPRGAALPLMEMFSEMVEYNGGQPLRCLA